MAKIRFLTVWIDQRKSIKTAKKKIVICFTQNEILKQNNFAESALERTPKLFRKAFLLGTIFCQNYETLEVPTQTGPRPPI